MRTAREVPTPWDLQEHHDLADGFLVAPGQPDLGGPLGTDAGDLDQPLALLLDDVEHGLAERLDQLLRVDRADALDQPRAQVLLHALQR